MTIQYRTTRRGLATLAVLALVLAACGSGSPTTSAGGSAGGEPEPAAGRSRMSYCPGVGRLRGAGLLGRFCRCPSGHGRQFEFGATDADILALMEGGSEADIFHFYTGWQQFYVDEGLVQEIDTSAS